METFNNRLKQVESNCDIPDNIEILSSVKVKLVTETDIFYITIEDVVNYIVYSPILGIRKLGEYIDYSFDIEELAKKLLKIFKILNPDKLKKLFKENKYEPEN